MSGFTWFEAAPPRDLKHEQVTAFVRPLASRPRLGVLGLMPVVAFELWLTHNTARWLVGVDNQLAVSLPPQLWSQMPGLHLGRLDDPARPEQQLGCSLRIYSLAYPLRLDTALAVTNGLMHVARDLADGESAVVQWVVGPSFVRREHPQEFNLATVLGFSEPHQPDGPERTAWRTKIAEPLFGVRGRAAVSVATPAKATMTLRALVGALRLANGPHARLRAGMPSKYVARNLASVMGPVRLWSSTVNAAELATLISWPLDGVTLPSSHGPAFGRAPIELLRPSSLVNPKMHIIGASLHPADKGELVTLPPASTTSHLHIIGPTGSGKSNLLTQLALADAASGRSLLIMEPKGDLIVDVLARLPKDRHDDVVIIEPGSELAVGFNPLRGPNADAERRADELLGLFKQLFGSSIGARSADVLLHALIMAARLPDGALTDVPTILTNPAFRRAALAKVGDPLVLGPFFAWYDQISQAERGQVITPIMNKVRSMTTRSALRRMLGQGEPTFNLDELFNEKRIVLINLNRGLLGPETSKLLGSLFLQQIVHAGHRRTAVPPYQRKPVTLMIDEWQNFTAGTDFDEALAQFRGLNISITVAHQHLGQLSPHLRAAVLANARSRIAFRPAADDTKALATVLGASVRPDDLASLGAYQAAVRLLVDGAVSPAFAVRTLPLCKPTADAAAIRRASLVRYGVNGNDLDERLRIRWNGRDDTPSTPIGVSRRPKP